ncbi:hypothetical protein SK128_004687 [Halocaridina rubra]|uniref:Uncharacterized protein n=1 Tax=Halocaridina rubra TaxID=373956 RepID=A0AAN8WMH2_HALRR
MRFEFNQKTKPRVRLGRKCKMNKKYSEKCVHFLTSQLRSPVKNCKKLIHFDVISFRIVPLHVLSASTLRQNIFNDVRHQQHTVDMCLWFEPLPAEKDMSKKEKKEEDEEEEEKEVE